MENRFKFQMLLVISSDGHSLPRPWLCLCQHEIRIICTETATHCDLDLSVSTWGHRCVLQRLDAVVILGRCNQIVIKIWSIAMVMYSLRKTNISQLDLALGLPGRPWGDCQCLGQLLQPHWKLEPQVIKDIPWFPMVLPWCIPWFPNPWMLLPWSPCLEELRQGDQDWIRTRGSSLFQAWKQTAHLFKPWAEIEEWCIFQCVQIDLSCHISVIW